MELIAMNKTCERVQDLISKTVSFVCKSSLQYEKEIKVEGLLGITLDTNQVLLVRINETFANLFGSTSVSLEPDSDARQTYVVGAQRNDGLVLGSNSEDELQSMNAMESRIISTANNISVHLKQAEETDQTEGHRKMNVEAGGASTGCNDALLNSSYSSFSLNLPPLIELNNRSSNNNSLQSESVHLNNSNCNRTIKTEYEEADVMIVQPVGTDEDADLNSLCSTLDETMDNTNELQDNDIQVISAPPGILDGYRRAGNKLWDRQSGRRRNIKSCFSMQKSGSNLTNAESPLDNVALSSSGRESVSSDNNNQQEITEIVDIKPCVSLLTNLPEQFLKSDNTSDSLPHLVSSSTLSSSQGLDPSQILASLGLVGLTTAVTLPVGDNRMVNSSNAGTSLSDNSTWSTATSKNSFDAFKLPIDMQNLVNSISKCQTKSSRGSHSCSLCGAHFLNADDHLRHMRTHSSSDMCSSSTLANIRWKVTCPFCDLLFGSTSTRNRHIRVVHERRVKWTCPICFHKITRSDNVKYHSCVKANRINLQKSNETVN